jgi:glycoside/pentoside/hexuronide:cation symporter, GPH family
LATATRLKRWSLAIFSAPCLPLSALGLPLTVYLPSYYSEQIGVPFAAVGLAFMLVRLIDMGFDPMIGGLMDRTRTRFGRFKPWLVAGAPILMLGIYLLFMVEPGASAQHLWLSLFVLYIGFSICQLSQVSWASLLSTGYDERSRIYAWWQGANVVGSLAIVLLPVVLQNVFGSSHATGVRAMGIFLIALIPISVALPMLLVAEPPPQQSQAAPQLMEYVRVFRSDAVRKAILADLLLATAMGVAGVLFFFFYRHAKGISEANAGTLILVYFVASLIGAPLWARLAGRWGKHVSLAIATVVFICAQAVIGLFLPGVLWVLALGIFFAGLPGSAAQLLLRAMIADVADEARVRSGRDDTGMLFGYITAVNKIGIALAVGIGFGFLGLAGVEADAEGVSGMSSLALHGVYIGVPCLLCALALPLLLRYPLTPAKHAQIRQLLDERAISSTISADPIDAPRAARFTHGEAST